MKLARALSWVVGGVIAVLPFHAFFTTWLASNIGRHDLLRVWKEVLLLLILPAILLLVWRSRALKRYLADSWISRLFLIYILLHLVLGLKALNLGDINSEAFFYSLIVNLRFIGFFFICLVLAVYSPFLLRNWRKLLLIPAAIVVAFGLLQKAVLPQDFLRHFGYGPDSLPAYQTVDSQYELRRIQSFLRGANPLGAYLILIISTLAFSLRKNRSWQIVALAASLIVLFFSYSRSAWLGLVVAVGFYAGFALARRRGSKLALVAVAAAMALVFTGIYSLRNNSDVQDTVFHTSERSTSPQSSNEVRVLALKQGASDVIHEPLGRGPGTAGPASFRTEKVPRIAENYYLQIGQEVGVFGLFLFLAINALVALQLLAKRAGTLPKVLLISLVGIGIVNLFLHGWTDDTISYLWWGLAGIALAPKLASLRPTR